MAIGRPMKVKGGLELELKSRLGERLDDWLLGLEAGPQGRVPRSLVGMWEGSGECTSRLWPWRETVASGSQRGCTAAHGGVPEDLRTSSLHDIPPEAAVRGVWQAQAEDLDVVEVDQLEKVLPQLLLDF
eukprot:XP_011247155.1 PREDICTED: centromere protein X isoform X6 [Mus musculus]